MSPTVTQKIISEKDESGCDKKLNKICARQLFLVPPQHSHTHTHTTILLLFWNMSGTTWVSRYQKDKTRQVKTNLDLLEQEIVSGSGICWAVCKSAPHPRQPHQHPTTQFFTGRMPFLTPNQQRQSTEGRHPFNGRFSTTIWVSQHKKGLLQ